MEFPLSSTHSQFIARQLFACPEEFCRLIKLLIAFPAQFLAVVAKSDVLSTSTTL